uniref:Putative secreted protein n=1 Tax=Anopheles darlingi TaxID=43151 RepID=A0A2M4DFX6_ANODA
MHLYLYAYLVQLLFWFLFIFCFVSGCFFHLQATTHRTPNLLLTAAVHPRKPYQGYTVAVLVTMSPDGRRN